MSGDSDDCPKYFWPVRVYYEDTDASGVVYLEFMERARTEWLRNRGFTQDAFRREDGLAFTVSRLNVEYVRPARLDEELDAWVQVEKVGRVSFFVRQGVERRAETLCRAQVRIACVNVHRFKPRRIPSSMSLELCSDH